MQFLKSRGIRDAEMMDTSLGPFLNQNLKNKISKNDLPKLMQTHHHIKHVPVDKNGFKIKRKTAWQIKTGKKLEEWAKIEGVTKECIRQRWRRHKSPTKK